MRSVTAIAAMVGFGLALAAHTPAARADGWSIAIGVPGVVVVPPGPAYGPPPAYYEPPYPPSYEPPPYFGRYYGGYYGGAMDRHYGPPAWVRGDDDDDDD